MPYHVGEKGSYGCSGYPAVKDDGTVMGCHKSAEEAANQIYAINQSEGNIPDKGVGIKDPQEWPVSKETDSGGMGSTIGQPYPASTKPSLLKPAKKKPKRSVGGAGGSSAGAVATTGGGSGMGTKADGKASLFADFGKDFTRAERLFEIFKSIGVGSMVSWNSSGGRAQGKITRIIRNGSYNVPGTSVTVTGTSEDPAAVIRLYRDGKPTDTIVAHKTKTLRQA
jgi:hypothetical protein